MKKLLILLTFLLISFLSYSQGISVGSGLSVKAQVPIDTRFIFQTIAERNALDPNYRFEGLFTYTLEDSTNWQLIGGITNDNWKAFGGSVIDSTAFPFIYSGGNTIQRNGGNLGIGMTNPQAKLTLNGSLSLEPLIVDSADIANGVTVLNSQIIYRDSKDVWTNWTHTQGCQFAPGVEGQIVMFKSDSTGRVYLRNNDLYGDSHPSFIMNGGDNIILQFANNTWNEVARTDLDSVYNGTTSLGSYDLYGIGITNTAMELNREYPIGYSSGRGVVIDSLVAITTGGVSNISVQISFGISISNPTNIFTTSYTITNINTFQKTSTFLNRVIPPGNIIWMSFSDVTTSPKSLMIQIIGHRL